MGSEDLFHKRKAKAAADFKRQKAKRKPYDRVLIVCEGEKTEPIYFEDARVYFDLDSANVDIDGSSDSSPLSIVKHALEVFNKELRKKNPFDRVFCVFDRDSHETFELALNEIDRINRQLTKDQDAEDCEFIAITSNPCFEYWLLLHYLSTDKPYTGTGNKSSADRVIDDLKRFKADYEKASIGTFQDSITMNTLDSAIANARRINQKSLESPLANPSTNVYTLIEYLRSLKDK